MKAPAVLTFQRKLGHLRVAHWQGSDGRANAGQPMMFLRIGLTTTTQVIKLEFNMISKRSLAAALAVAMLSASSVAVFAQDATTPAAPAAVATDTDDDDDGMDLGWLGLLGLAGLLGLRGRKHDDHVRTTNTRTTTGTH
jgi:hypothetical protein